MEKDKDKLNNSTSSIEEEEDNKRPYPRLDYTITDPFERNQKVHEIVNNTPSQKLTPYYLEQLTKYLTETPDTKKIFFCQIQLSATFLIFIKKNIIIYIMNKKRG